jgi:putative thioredoxin
MTNFGGALDLSRLTQKPAAATAPTAGASSAVGVISDWLVKADEQILRQYVALSEKTPVLMLIGDQSEQSAEVRAMVGKALRASEGRFAGVEIDITANPELARAVGVESAPAVIAILAGQPAPLFQGKPTSDQLLKVLAQVLQLAQQNGLTQTVRVEADTPNEPELSPAHQEAIAEIAAGNFEAAKAKFEKIIVEYPNDKDALAGLNQVKLMLRMQQTPSDPFEVGLAKADQKLIAGEPAQAFAILLDAFELSDRKDEIRVRLLELFTLIGEGDQDVLAARRRLTSLMF